MENYIPKPHGQPEVKYSGSIIEVLHQKMKIGNEVRIFEKARRSPGVRIMIVENNRMLIIKEYRTELEDWDFRIPGGKVFDTLEDYKSALESGENMLKMAVEAAKKEVLEETGLVVENINYFRTSGTGGPTVEWDMFYFVVDEFCESKNGQMLEHGENITCRWMNFEEVKKMCMDGTIKEDRTVANILRFVSRYI
ncbi:MAG: NUDIX hydrolase [Candidatus Aenigmarchaeota archaeon]|nr:NUDIX hydrolase [Candidatus Aenigmarchaeota archaeon]